MDAEVIKRVSSTVIVKWNVCRVYTTVLYMSRHRYDDLNLRPIQVDINVANDVFVQY